MSYQWGLELTDYLYVHTLRFRSMSYQWGLKRPCDILSC